MALLEVKPKSIASSVLIPFVESIPDGYSVTVASVSVSSEVWDDIDIFE